MTTFYAEKGKYGPSEQLKDSSDDFVAQIYSIMEINGSIIPEMSAKDTELRDQIGKRIIAQLSEDEREKYAAHLRSIGENLLSVVNVATGSAAEGEVEKAKLAIEIPERGVGSAVQHLIFDLAARSKAGSRDELMRKSLLVTAISTFEVLFGRIARSVFAVNKAALNDSEHAFTLQELASFSTLDDARELLIEQRISGLLRDSVDAWDKWLKKAAGGLSLEELAGSWPVVREAFARRNLIVHTGGVVNHLYVTALSKLDLPSGVTLPPVGVKLPVDREYLDRVLQELLALGRILTCAVGAKLHKRDHELFTNAALHTARELSMKRAWVASAAVCEYLLSLKLDRRSEMNAKVRLWLSRREVEGLDAIRAEIENWDTSGLSAEISHCKPVLLKDAETALPVIDELIAAGKLSKFEVAIDPLYEGLVRSSSDANELTSGDE